MWRGVLGPYRPIVPPPPGGGGGYVYGQIGFGFSVAIRPGVGGGGGRVPSKEPPLSGYNGCGGPGPGAYIGLGGR